MPYTGYHVFSLFLWNHFQGTCTQFPVTGDMNFIPVLFNVDRSNNYKIIIYQKDLHIVTFDANSSIELISLSTFLPFVHTVILVMCWALAGAFFRTTLFDSLNCVDIFKEKMLFAAFQNCHLPHLSPVCCFVFVLSAFVNIWSSNNTDTSHLQLTFILYGCHFCFHSVISHKWGSCCYPSVSLKALFLKNG